MTHPKDTTPDQFCECGCGQVTGRARQSRRDKGIVKGQPMRFVSGHHRRKYPPISYEVDEVTGCWNWTGSMSDTGYGAVNLENEHFMAHRAVYEQFNGAIPEGLELDHLCRNRRCVNPNHLEPVTHAVNARRGINTKLTADAVQEMRELHSTVSNSDLAVRFGVSRSHVSRVLRYKKWRL